MKKELDQSITFILSEYKRLKRKEESNELTESEKKTLEKLASFLGKDQSNK